MQQTLKAWDTINGALASVYIVKNGQRTLAMNVKDLEAKVSKNKREIKVLGNAGSKHKSAGWSGTGTLTMYYGTSALREAMLDYMETGKDTYFEIIVTNSDPSSDIGEQTVQLTGVNFDDTILAKVDINSTELDESLTFTFQGANMLNKFKEYVGE